MPLYEIESTGELGPFRRLRADPEIYEREIEALVWSDPEAFLGEPLFLVRRQAILPGGFRPDIVALDKEGHVVILEVTDRVDRQLLSQILEYAGWARTTDADQISAMYHNGHDSFASDWKGFGATDASVPIDAHPRLVLVARDFHGQTRSAFDFLVENGLPIRFVPASLYVDEKERRFLEIEGEEEADWPGVDPPARVDRTQLDDRRVRPGAKVAAAAGDTEAPEAPREEAKGRGSANTVVSRAFVASEIPPEATD
jgi:hypothetical protein